MGEFTKRKHANISAQADKHDPKAHASSHKSGGSDEIDVPGLTPKAHASSHQNGGTDEIDVTGLTGAGTKEFWAKVDTGKFSGTVSNLGLFPAVLIDADGEYVFVSFIVPNDFSSLTDAVWVVASTATASSVDIDISSNYGASGEAYNNGSESDTSSTYDFTANELTEIDASGILTDIAAGDYVAVQLKLKQTLNYLKPLGFRFRYS